jgi:hypothetical protein
VVIIIIIVIIIITTVITIITPFRWQNGICKTQTIERSESRCVLRLRYVDLAVIIEVAVEVCCCLTVFGC